MDRHPMAQSGVRLSSKMYVCVFVNPQAAGAFVVFQRLVGRESGGGWEVWQVFKRAQPMNQLEKSAFLGSCL